MSGGVVCGCLDDDDDDESDPGQLSWTVSESRSCSRQWRKILFLLVLEESEEPLSVHCALEQQQQWLIDCLSVFSHATISYFHLSLTYSLYYLLLMVFLGREEGRKMLPILLLCSGERESTLSLSRSPPPPLAQTVLSESLVKVKVQGCTFILNCCWAFSLFSLSLSFIFLVLFLAKVPLFLLGAGNRMEESGKALCRALFLSYTFFPATLLPRKLLLSACLPACSSSTLELLANY